LILTERMLSHTHRPHVRTVLLLACQLYLHYSIGKIFDAPVHFPYEKKLAYLNVVARGFTASAPTHTVDREDIEEMIYETHVYRSNLPLHHYH